MWYGAHVVGTEHSVVQPEGILSLYLTEVNLRTLDWLPSGQPM